MNSENIKPSEKVIAALKNKNYKWRTIKGIVNETNLDTSLVEDCLQKSEQIVRSVKRSAEGEYLYTSKEHFQSFASPLEKLRGSLKNRLD